MKYNITDESLGKDVDITHQVHRHQKSLQRELDSNKLSNIGAFPGPYGYFGTLVENVRDSEKYKELSEGILPS